MSQNHYVSVVEDENTYYHPLLDDLKSIKVMLKDYDKEQIKEFIKTHLSNDVEELKNKFNEEFQYIDDYNLVKREIIHLFKEYGIMI